jgi:hypothetical protein
MAKDGGLRSLFRENLPKFHWTSIESPLTGMGTPDANYCYDSIEGWIEFKQTKGWAVTLRVEQVGWLLRRTRAGGRTFVAVRRKNELYLFRGSDARSLRENGIKGALPVAHETGGPAKWRWLWLATLLAPPRPKPQRNQHEK